MEFFTKDGGDELRVGMDGNMFSWGKPTGPAGNQEFVLWKKIVQANWWVKKGEE